jgi:DNA-binding GntR family transcriptional regulator
MSMARGDLVLVQPKALDGRASVEAVVEHTAEVLRERIIGGALSRGQVIAGAELAGDLGTPPSLVRKALHRVQAQGYVVRSGRRTVVAPLRLEARYLLDRRLELECMLTRRAAQRLARLDLARLERLHGDFVDAERRYDHIALQRSNYRFHIALYRLAGEPEALREVQALWADFPFDLLTVLPHRRPVATQEHFELLGALHEGDADRAASAMRTHILQGWRAIEYRYPLDLSRRRSAG